MAKLVIVTHEFDVFVRRDPSGTISSMYMLWDVMNHLAAMGHDCHVTTGPKPHPGDIALLHVDASVVPEEYLALAAHYEATINFAATDITKRRISSLRLAPGDDWSGPVIVKSNLNSEGKPEVAHNRLAEIRKRAMPHPGAMRTPYRIFNHRDEVDDADWQDPSLIVEKFITEPDASGGFAFRTWVFMGSRERCTRFVGPKPIGKANDAVENKPVDVPPELRAERERLGFDFGKFDWIMHDGHAVLIDANRTPGTARSIESFISAGSKNLADGLNGLIADRLPRRFKRGSVGSLARQ